MKRFATAALIAFMALPRLCAALLPEEENTIQVFRGVAPSVVFVTNIAVRQNVFMDVFAVPQGAGSGFIWDREGHIVTNYHVVAGGNAFLVTLKDHTELEATVVGVEPRKDIAVLKVTAAPDKLKPVLLGDSDRLQVGQKTLAIGNPFALDYTLTTGIVSALGRKVQSIARVTIQDMIQTDAAINPGNSGGPLLDSSGSVIGMNMSIYSPSGASAGIGFAVPINTIKRIVPQIIRHGRATQPGIGVSVLRDDQKIQLLGNVEGVVVREVEPDLPAQRAGVRGLRLSGGRIVLGDVIVGIDGQRVKDYDDLYNVLERHKVGDSAEFKFLRNGKTRQIAIELIEIP